MKDKFLLEAKRYRVLALLVVISAIMTACAKQPVPQAFDPPSFWAGLFHGFTIFFSLIGSIFTDNRIYAFPNSGGWYDLGYFLGAATFLGGGSVSVR